MISREQFEALVRAEAERRWPMPDDEPDFTSLDRQTAYIAARMEHEWPLVAALYAIMEAHGPGTLCSERIYEGAVMALSPYTTKPIER